MDCNDLSISSEGEFELEASIKSALALLDPKGTDVQVSRAMSIVSLAFAAAKIKSQVCPDGLYTRAIQINHSSS